MGSNRCAMLSRRRRRTTKAAHSYACIGTAVAYVCNSMLWDGITGPDQRWLPWTKALRDALGL